MMKTQIIAVLIGIMTVTMSCSSDDDKNAQESSLIGEWHVVHLTGGIGGVDEYPERDEIVWIFTQDELTVIDAFLGSPGDPVTRSYEVVTVQGATYLTINGQDFGKFSLANDQLFIDTNKLPAGGGNDGYLYTLAR